MTSGLVKGTANQARWASSLGVAVMAAASLLWSLTATLVLMSTGVVHAPAVKAVAILGLMVLPGSALVGGALGYWIASARPSPVGTATLGAIATVIVTALFLFFISTWSAQPSSWAGATFGGVFLALTAAPFWFAGALVLYDRIEKQLLYHTDLLEERASPLAALFNFCMNPTAAATTKLAHPLISASYLLIADLFLVMFIGFVLVFPLRKYFGATFGHFTPRWTLILVAAAIEEFTFRLPLKYSASNLTVSTLFFTFSTIRSLMLRFGNFGLPVVIRASLWSAVVAISIASIVFALLRTERVKRIVGSIWLDHFKAVVYFSCIVFGLMHVFNFTSITAASLFFAPILVLPQIISGFIFAFARMRLGMIWCIVLHTAHNALFFLLSPVKPHW